MSRPIDALSTISARSKAWSKLASARGLTNLEANLEGLAALASMRRLEILDVTPQKPPVERPITKSRLRPIRMTKDEADNWDSLVDAAVSQLDALERVLEADDVLSPELEAKLDAAMAELQKTKVSPK